MLIIDTGVIVAAADRNDSHHNESVELIQQAPGPLVTTGLVIAECAYLIQRQLGPIAEATIYQSIVDGSLRSRCSKDKTGFASEIWSPRMPTCHSAEPMPASLQ